MIFNSFLNLIVYLFIFHCECQFSSFINLNNEKSKVIFISMSRISETRLASNAILLNMSASHQSLCMNRCIKTTNCTSYNIFKNNESLFRCQLLSENKYSNSNQLEKKNGWIHASIQSVSCDRSPCKNNGLCTPIYAENHYVCYCSAEYLGPFCETELHRMVSLPMKNLGCWKDTLNRALTTLEGSSIMLNDLYQSRQNAIEKCFKIANLKGYSIFSVQGGGYCSASNDDSYKKYGLSNVCNGNGKGGLMANQVYVITKKLSFKHAGCWADQEVRSLIALERIASILDGSYKTRVNAINKCHFAAAERNYEVFALQDGGWCAAGNGDSFKIYGTSLNCGADGKGGVFANAVYIIDRI
ncbi:uncharacterized protein LOC105843710 isoform X2 [Hydra vulgaris]|uniref:Uncharacterized protein LOC105843710 isoform X2 n=1 Tax=Hydra vulgaris TaxID=6087 RepID=A0ABM4BM41_HYDVU